MRVLWITPIIMPAVSRRLGSDDRGSGGWLGAMMPLLQQADPAIDLSVITIYDGAKIVRFEEANVTYYLLPDKGSIFKDNPHILKCLHDAILILKPDLIDIQGVEFHYAKYVNAAAPGIPIVATLQGLISEIYKHYCGCISVYNLLKFRTLKDNLFLDGMLERKIDYQKRGVSEIEALQSINYVIGRTSWDHSVCRAINPGLRYFYCQNNIREEFFGRTWKRDAVNSYSIFVAQSHTPYKGLHVLLEAASIVKGIVPNIKIVVAGRNMLDRSTINQALRFGGYQKYIQYLIQKYGLGDIIYFTGPLDSSQMAEKMSKSHVFVLPSFVENSPNSLAEAQVMGVPSIAAFVGGVPDMVTHHETGLLYNSSDSAVLASLLQQIFFDDNLADHISRTSRRYATERYNSSKGGSDLANIYESIYCDYLKTSQDKS